jgi:hypothetical protein
MPKHHYHQSIHEDCTEMLYLVCAGKKRGVRLELREAARPALALIS